MYKVYLVMRHDGDQHPQPVAVFPNKSSAEGFVRGDQSPFGNLYIVPVPYHDDEV